MTLFPTKHQIDDLRAGDNSEKVVMLNMLVFKKPEDYTQYSREVGKLLPHYEGRVIWRGQVRSVVIGEDVPGFHAVMLVEYGNHDKFLAMTSSDEYLAIKHYRETGLESQWLISMSEMK